jgi:hypothetical protein
MGTLLQWSLLSARALASRHHCSVRLQHADAVAFRVKKRDVTANTWNWHGFPENFASPFADAAHGRFDIVDADDD